MITQQAEEIIDVTEQFPFAIQAEQHGRNVLIMRELDVPIKRVDGKLARYALEHRWLSDTRYTNSVRGNEFTYWLKKEWEPGRGLFDQFQLF